MQTLLQPPQTSENIRATESRQTRGGAKTAVLGCANRGEARAAVWRMKRRGRGAEARGREAGSSGGHHCNHLATVARGKGKAMVVAEGWRQTCHISTGATCLIACCYCYSQVAFTFLRLPEYIFF